jgi:hypothetical protein
MFYSLHNQDPVSLNEIKKSVYNEIGLKYLVKFVNHSAHNANTKQFESFNQRFFLQDLTEYQFVWYLSDLFFWIIYFGAFISARSVLLTSNESQLDVSPNQMKNRKKNFPYAFCLYFKEFFVTFMIVFDDFEHFIGVYLRNFKFYSLLKSLFNVQKLFRCLYCLCLSGAFLKFYSSLMTIVNSIMKLIFIEDNFKKYQELKF